MSVRLGIGWLNAHGFPVAGQVFDCYEQMQQRIATGLANVGLPPDLQLTSCRRINATSFPVDYARNEICQAVLDGDDTHLLFLDLDHLWQPDLPERLLRARKPVITARYHMRREPYHAAVYVKHRTLEGKNVYAPVHFGRGVFEVERGGAGALLVERRVLQDIYNSIGHNWFRYQRNADPPHDFSVSEDFWFYEQARRAGHRCWCDWDTEVQHLQQMAIDGAWNQMFLDRQVEALARMDDAGRQAVLDNFVVCGYPEGLTLSSGDVVAPYTYTPGER